MAGTDTEYDVTVSVNESVNADVGSTQIEGGLSIDETLLSLSAESPDDIIVDANVNTTEALEVTAEENTGGTDDHRKLYHRDSINQHPIGAITGLQSALDTINGTLTGHTSSITAAQATADTAGATATQAKDDVNNLVEITIPALEQDIEDIDEKAENAYNKEYKRMEWAISSSNVTAPVSGWSTTVPSTTQVNKYLWSRTVTVVGTAETTSAASLVETTYGATLFMSSVGKTDAYGRYTLIDGGSIDTTNLYLGRIGTNGLNYAEVNSSGLSIVQNGVEVASYQGNYVYLGKSSTYSYVSLCNSLGLLYGDNIGGHNTFCIQSTGDISIYAYNGSVSIGSETTVNAFLYSSGFQSMNTITALGYIYGAGLEIPRHLKVTDPATTSSGTPVVWSSGKYYLPSSNSARKYKKDIKPVENEELDPHKLYDIEVVQFKYKDGYLIAGDENEGKDIIGFIADQMEEVYPISVFHNDEGEVENWLERFMIPPMLKLIQEQHAEIEMLKSRLGV